MSPLLLVVAAGAASAGAITLLSTTARRRRTGTVVAVDPDAAESWLVRHAPSRSVPILRTLDRQVVGGAALAVIFVVVLVTSLFLGWVLDGIDHRSGFARWDEAAAEWGAQNATDLSTAVLERITDLGGTPLLVAAVVLVSAVDLVRFRNWNVPLHLGAVLGSAVVVSNGVKIIVDRERPDIAQLVGWSGASFPSGHSAAAAAGWAAIAFVLTRTNSRRVRVIAMTSAVGVAVLVAASRVLLGVHWLTDVVAGLALGWGCFVLMSVVVGGWLERLGEPADRIVDADDATVGVERAEAAK
jgi:undecaprenyl-diphosphatase